MPSTSGRSDEIMIDAGPVLDEPVHQQIDVVPRRDVDAARRLVEDEDVGAGRQPLRQHHLLLVAAAQVQHAPVRVPACGSAGRQSPARASRALAARGRMTPKPRQRARGATARRCVRPRGRSTSPCCLRSSGQEPDPAARRIGRRADPRLASRDHDAPAIDPVGADDRARQPGAAGADQAGDAQDLSAAQHERDVPERAAAECPRRAGAPRRARARGADSGRLTSRFAISRTSSGTVTSAMFRVATWHPSRSTVTRCADAEHLVHPVRDVDDGHAARRSGARSSGTAARPRARSAPRSARPSRGCAPRLPARVRPRPSAAARAGGCAPAHRGSMRHAEPVEDARAPRGACAASRRRPGHRVGVLPRKMFSATDEVRNEAELLIDRADAELARPLRIAELDRLAVEQDLAGVASHRAAEDLHQRRLAAPFSPSSDVHLAGAHVEVGVVQRAERRDTLADAAHLQQRRLVCSHGSACSGFSDGEAPRRCAGARVPEAGGSICLRLRGLSGAPEASNMVSPELQSCDKSRLDC